MNYKLNSYKETLTAMLRALENSNNNKFVEEREALSYATKVITQQLQNSQQATLSDSAGDWLSRLVQGRPSAENEYLDSAALSLADGVRGLSNAAIGDADDGATFLADMVKRS